MSPFPQTHFDVNGRSYKVTALPARKSRRLLAKLIKAIGPALGSAFKGTLDIKDAIGHLCANLDPDLLDEVCDTFAEVCVTEDGTSLSRIFDTHFALRSGDMFLWLKACLTTEYASFLDELRTDVEPDPQDSPEAKPSV